MGMHQATHRPMSAAGVFLLCAGAAFGQSFNIDFTSHGAPPSETYAGAGDQPGVWNSVNPPNFGATVPLFGLDGNLTDVTIVNLGGEELQGFAGPVGASADEHALMSDCLITRNASLESCIFFAGLEAGMYEVTIYAWMPDAPGVLSWATVDEAPGTGQNVGGEWAGQQELGVTYSRHTAEVLADGRLRTHSGIAAGADAALGAAMNGIQITLLGACPADIDGDGMVGSGDLAVMLAAWGSPCPLAAPTCAPDLNGDGNVDSADLAVLLAAWGPCG